MVGGLFRGGSTPLHSLYFFGGLLGLTVGLLTEGQTSSGFTVFIWSASSVAYIGAN